MRWASLGTLLASYMFLTVCPILAATKTTNIIGTNWPIFTKLGMFVMPFQISLPCSHIDMASCTKYVCEKCATFMKRFYLGKWIIKTRKLLSPLKPNDNYSTIFVLTISSPPFCIYAYLMILIMNSNYYLKQHQSFNPCNGEVLCSLRGTDERTNF